MATVLDELERTLKENQWQLEDCANCGQTHIVQQAWTIERGEFGMEIDRFHENVFGCIVEENNSKQARFVMDVLERLPSLLAAARAGMAWTKATTLEEFRAARDTFDAALAPLLKEVGR